MSGTYFAPLQRVFLNLSGGTVTGDTLFTQSVSATTFYSGSTNLYDIFAVGANASLRPTYVGFGNSSSGLTGSSSFVFDTGNLYVNQKLGETKIQVAAGIATATSDQAGFNINVDNGGHNSGFYRHFISGNVAGTSIPYYHLTTIRTYFGATNAVLPIATLGSVIYNLPSETSTSYGTSLDGTGLTIGQLQYLHTGNTVPFKIISNNTSNQVLARFGENIYFQTQLNGFSNRTSLSVGGMIFSNAASTPLIQSSDYLEFSAPVHYFVNSPNMYFNDTNLYIGTYPHTNTHNFEVAGTSKFASLTANTISATTVSATTIQANVLSAETLYIRGGNSNYNFRHGGLLMGPDSGGAYLWRADLPDASGTITRFATYFGGPSYPQNFGSNYASFGSTTVGVTNNSAYISVGGSVADRASISIESGVTVTNPYKGDIWNEGHHIVIGGGTGLRIGTGSSAGSDYKVQFDLGGVNPILFGNNNAYVTGSNALWMGASPTISNYTLLSSSIGTTVLNGSQNVSIYSNNNIVANFHTFVNFTPLATNNGSAPKFSFATPADTTMAASTEAMAVMFSHNSLGVQHSTGAITDQRDFAIFPRTHRFVGASTITNAASFYVAGPPVAGTNATITNPFSVWVSGTTFLQNVTSSAILRLNRSGSGAFTYIINSGDQMLIQGTSGLGSSEFGFSPNSLFYIGPGLGTLSSRLTISGGNSTYSQLHLKSGGTPSAPTNGEIWNDGTRFNFATSGLSLNGLHFTQSADTFVITGSSGYGIIRLSSQSNALYAGNTATFLDSQLNTYIRAGGTTVLHMQSTYLNLLKQTHIGLTQSVQTSSWLNLQSASTTISSLRINSGVTVTSPLEGDVWNDGSHLYARVAGQNRELDTFLEPTQVAFGSSTSGTSGHTSLYFSLLPSIARLSIGDSSYTGQIDYKSSSANYLRIEGGISSYITQFQGGDIYVRNWAGTHSLVFQEDATVRAISFSAVSLTATTIKANFITATTLSATTIQSDALRGSTERMVQADTGGTLYASQEIVSGIVTDPTAITLLTTSSNWNMAGIYTGTTITNTYQGQFYGDTGNTYVYLALADNYFARIPRV